MNDLSVAVPAVLKARAKRARRARDVQDRLFDLALQHWFEWLLQFHCPRAAPPRILDGNDVKDAWTGFQRRTRSNTEHSDSVLDRLLADERGGHDWPASIHAIVLEFPRTWQLALIGAAMKLPQQVIAEAVGVHQSNISRMIDLIKTRFLPALLMVSCTERVCMHTFGVSRPHLRFA